MAKSKSLTNFAQVIRSYDQLAKFATAFGSGHLNLLILTGNPGLGKSRELMAATHSNACVIDGNSTAFGMYLRHYEGRNERIVIDDVDGLHRDRSAVRLLKSLCQSEPSKTLAWNSDSRTLVKLGVPRTFTTTSKVAIIANQWERLNIDVSALEDRGHVLHFDPPAAEVHNQASKWFWDQEVFDFVGDHLNLIQQPSFRHYLAAAELKQAGFDWKDMVLSRCITGKMLVVAQLKADGRFITEEDRARAFVAAGEGCRATYFNVAKKMPPKVETPKVTLNTLSPIKVPPANNLVDLLTERYGTLGNG